MGTLANINSADVSAISGSLTERHAEPVRHDAACQWCGASYALSVRNGNFCGKACSLEFHNLAKTRGAALYHLFMCTRYERGVAKRLKVWSAMCKLAAHWRDEDQRERGGRASWRRARSVIKQYDFILRAIIVVRGRNYVRPEPVRRDQ